MSVLDEYNQAMAIDPETGKPMSRVEVVIKSAPSVTEVIHDQVVVSPDTSIFSGWIDISNYSSFGITMSSDKALESHLALQWSNNGGATMHAAEVVLTGTSPEKPLHVKKVSNWVRFKVMNHDPSQSQTLTTYINKIPV